MKTEEVEYCIARYFDPRRNIVVPNVWWGMGLNHECDLMVLTQTGYAYEVEIKISKADLKRDQKKKHGHKEDKHYSNGQQILRKLYFAIPHDLESYINLIPERAGILSVGGKHFVKKIREAQTNPNAKQLTPDQIQKLAHLGTMRIWPLKRELADLRQRFEDGRSPDKWRMNYL